MNVTTKTTRVFAVEKASRKFPRRSGLALAVMVAGAIGWSASAGAVELQSGDWTIDVGGFINAYYTSTSCSGDDVGGLALASRGLGCAGEDHRTTIGNGLLPNALVTKFKTTQDGIDIGGQIGIMVHTATSSGVAPNSGVDVRQAFFTLGTADWGTVKIGRDYGTFGSNAILGDMTLIGAGAPVQATQRDRVTLGHIGAGYTYLDNYGQITWSSPSYNGLVFTGGLFSPVDNGGAGILDYVSKSYPQVQAQLAWSNAGFKVWVGAKTQKFYGAAGSDAQGDNFNESAGEIGASFTAGAFSFLANFQDGKGIGILSDGDQGPVKGQNYFLQGTFNVTPKLKLGLNYGQSRNKGDNDFNFEANAGFKSNNNTTGGLYYSLTKSVTLAFEVSQTNSKDYFGNKAKMWGGSAGGIVFF